MGAGGRHAPGWPMAWPGRREWSRLARAMSPRRARRARRPIGARQTRTALERRVASEQTGLQTWPGLCWSPATPVLPRAGRAGRPGAGSDMEGSADDGRQAGGTHRRADQATAGQAGLEGEPGQGLRPGLQGGLPEEEGRRRAAGDGHRDAGPLPGAAGRAGHLRGAGVPAGAGRGRQGRDDPPRYERGEPAGREGDRLQGALGGGTRPRLSVALRPPPARARRHRDLQPVALRGGPGGAGAPGESGSPAAARRSQGQGGLGAALPGDQRLGALPDR